MYQLSSGRLQYIYYTNRTQGTKRIKQNKNTKSRKWTVTLRKIRVIAYIHRVSKKLCQCYFVNNSVKHWPNLIIFGKQHRKETWHKRPQFYPPNINTVATLPCEMRKSYFGRLQQWIHVGYRMPAQKIIVRPENHWKSVTSLTLIRSKSIVVYLERRRTEKTHQQRVGRSESHGYWMCSRRVAQHLRACVRAGGGHFEHIL